MAPHTSYVTYVYRSTALLSTLSRYVHVTARALRPSGATARAARQAAGLDGLTPAIHDARLTHIKYRHVIPNTTIFNIDNFNAIR